jgi:hypothetical protein
VGQHADLIVDGSGSLDHDQETEIAFRVAQSG